ncbi:MAG: RDD family protein [Steroidobacteraceae bacterium]
MITTRNPLVLLLTGLLLSLSLTLPNQLAWAAETRSEPPERTGAVEAPEPPQAPEAPQAAGAEKAPQIVNVGADSTLEAGKTAEVVVSVFGSSTALGEVNDAVVSVFGDSRAEQRVGDAVVAVFGNTYVNGPVGDAVVSILGDVELGPKADVKGDVVSIGGTIIRDPGAITHAGIQNVLGGHFGGLKWLRPWFEHCLILGRPLAFADGLGWAWITAFVFLGLYALTALMFPAATDRCVKTMEEAPGRSALAGLLTTLGAPVLVLLLCVTVVGLVAVPFVSLGLLALAGFGKGVMLAWLGRRVLRSGEGALAHPALAVIVGGLIAMLLYVVPFLGFLFYKLLGFMGLGVVVYTLILERQQSRSAQGPHDKDPRDKGPRGGTNAAPAATAEPPAAEPPPASATAPPETATPGAAPAQMAAATAATLPRAGFWMRMAALAIDLVLVSVVLRLVLPDGWHSMRGTLLLLAVYGAVMWKLRGATVGGIICNLQVVRIDGRELDWATAAVRSLGCFLSLVVAFLGFIWILFDAEHQSWHDKIAGTVVVRTAGQRSLV